MNKVSIINNVEGHRVHFDGDRTAGVQSKGAILLLGNYRPALTVARALCEAGYRIVMGTGGGEGFTEYSRSVSEKWAHPSVSDTPEEFTECLSEFLIRNPEMGLIYPVSEEFVEFFSKQARKLPRPVVIVSPPSNVVETCRDKVALLDLAGKVGISCPAYRTLLSTDDLKEVAEAVGYPVIIRPLPPERRIGHKKAVIIEQSCELEAVQACMLGCDGPWLVQKFFSGLRHDVFFASQEGEILSSMQVQYLRTDHEDGTGLCVSGRVETLQSTVAKPTAALVDAMNYTGIGCAQYLIDPETGTACLLEINPRTSAIHKVTERAGLGFSELAVCLATGTVRKKDIIARPKTTGQTFVWSYGDLRGIKSALLKQEIGVVRALQKLTKMIWSGLRADMHLTWSWRDPLPTLLLYIDQLRLRRIGAAPDLARMQVTSQSDPDMSERDNPNALTWTRIDSFSEARETWQYLEKFSNPSPFQKFDWLQSYSATFDPDGETELAIMVGKYKGEDPVALFPLCIRKRWGVRTLEWIGQTLNDYNAPIIVSKEHRGGREISTEQVWDDIVARIGNVDVISLLRQPCVLSGRRNLSSYFSSFSEASSAHALRLGRDWSSFSKSIFSKSTLRRLKEKSRKLSKQGDVSYTWHRSQKGRSQAVSRILEWKCLQLQKTGARNAFEDRRSMKFLIRAVNSCPEGCKVITLDLNGAPIAGIITLEAETGPLIYVMAYDQGQYSRLSPGIILLHRVIETAINDNQHVLDFSVGDEPYKVALCNSHTEMRQSIKGYSVKGRIVAKFLQARLHLKRKVKQNNEMMSLLQRGNRWRGKFKSTATQPA